MRRKTVGTPSLLAGFGGAECFAQKSRKPRIDGHLVTATIARPYMTDFIVAQVCRRLWRHQQVIAFAARHSRRGRLSVPVIHMTTSSFVQKG
jgi:hypothetical protein